jgi:hypothetical protein
MNMLNIKYDFVSNRKVDEYQSFFFHGMLVFLTWCNNVIYFNEIQQIFFQQQVSDLELPL